MTPDPRDGSMAGWRTIDSAPKDGTPVLGYCQPRHIDGGPMSFTYCAVVWWRGKKFKESFWPWRIHHDDSGAEPTHWISLPEPPIPSPPKVE